MKSLLKNFRTWLHGSEDGGCLYPPKCYICEKKDDVINLKTAKLYTIAGHVHLEPSFRYHPSCIEKALNLPSNKFNNSMIDRAIEITDSIKRMQDEKQKVLQEQQKKRILHF